MAFIIKHFKIFLFLIIIFGAILRFYNLSSTPISLNPDELAIGYNAYSFITTGKDEWGNSLPLSYKSFGDWKLPVYPALTMPFIQLLGLNELAVRIPAAIAGVVLILLMYLIAKELFGKKIIGLIAAVLITVSPYALFFSRGAYEPNLALCLCMAGVWLFLKFVNSKDNIWYLISSAILFGLCLFTYHPFMVFTPLIIFVLFFSYFNEIIKRRASLIIGAGIFGIFCLITLYALSLGSSSKLSSVGIFGNDDVVYRRAEKLLTDKSNGNLVFEKALFNKFTAVPQEFAQNYLNTFSPAFLFNGNTTKLFYSIGSYGYLHLVDVIFIAFGIFGLITRREKAGKFLFLWLLVAPIPSAITIEAPSVTRLIQIVPLIILVASYGVYYLLEISKKNYQKAFVILVLLFFLFNISNFLYVYFVHMNNQNARFFHYGYKEAVEIANKYPDKKIVMVGPQNFSYISFLFYNKYDANKFREEVKYYPPTTQGFYLVKSFGNYEFVDEIDRENLQENTLYIDNYISGDKNYISYPTGEPEFSYFTKEDLEN